MINARSALSTIVFLIVSCLLLQHANSQPVGMDIGYGGGIVAEITERGEKHIYKFNADAGDIVIIRMNRTSGDLNPYLELFGPDSTPITRQGSPYPYDRAEIQVFAAGVREIVEVTLDIVANTTADSTTIEFIDQPVVREVADVKADPLPTIWQPGTIRLTRGYEADAKPRKKGDGRLTIIDWVRVGRFVARLDTASIVPNEFQRADCAPSDSCGNGVADWVQAGRYVAGLDPKKLACGPVSPQSTGNLVTQSSIGVNNTDQVATNRVFGIATDSLFINQYDTLVIAFEAMGRENALGFSLQFDPNRLRFESDTLGSGAFGAKLFTNASQKDSGRVGIALALPTGQVFAAGTHKIVSLVFMASDSGTTQLHFGDNPVFREVVDTGANTLAATFGDTTIILVDRVATAIETEERSHTPISYHLAQNHPNPFNPTTVIRYQIPTAGVVELTIYNTLGQQVRTLVNAVVPVGEHSIRWDGRNDAGERVPSGVYLYRLKAGEFVQQRKMLLVQ